MLAQHSGDEQAVGRPNMPGLVNEIEVSRRTSLVQHSALFSGIPARECREIVSAAHEKQFARRQTIYLEGDPVGHMILMTSGCAKIVQFGQNGSEVILCLRGAGEVVGTAGLRPHGRHCSMAQALSVSTALIWESAIFEGFLQRSLPLRRNITHILCQQLQELEERYREISTERVAARLSHQLVRLLNQIGRNVNGSVEISLSREELAQLTGTTLFTVSRLLSGWNKKGIVSTRREAVAVHNLQALAELAESE